MEIIVIRTTTVGKVVRSASSWCWWRLLLADPEPSADQEGNSAGLAPEGDRSPETPPAFGFSARAGLFLGLPVPSPWGREDRRSQAGHQGDRGRGTFCLAASVRLWLGFVYKEDLGGPGRPAGCLCRTTVGRGRGCEDVHLCAPTSTSSSQGRPRRPRWRTSTVGRKQMFH